MSSTINPTQLIANSPQSKSHLQVLFFHNPHCKISKHQLQQWKQIEQEVQNYAKLHYVELPKVSDEYLERYQISRDTDSPLLQVFYQEKPITLSINGYDQDEKFVGYLDVEQWRDNLRMMRDNVEKGLYMLRVY